MKVSIIICFYERLKYLQRCLDSLISARDNFDEVIVADDGSSPEIVDRLKILVSNYPFPIKHAWQPKNGFRAAAARNNGVRQAIGDYLIFFDCDFLVLPGTIEKHLISARRRRFLSGYCKYLSKDITDQILIKGIKSFDIEQLYNDISDKNLKRDHRKFISRTWRIRMHLASYRKQTLGGHFSIHRKDFESVNGYDENFVGWGGEDIDLGIRLITYGIIGRSVIRSARVLHMCHTRESKSADWEKGSNIDYFNRKYINPVCKMGLSKST